MSTVREIEEAIGKLPTDDLAALRARFAEFDADAWDRRFERDVAEGRWMARPRRRRGACEVGTLPDRGPVPDSLVRTVGMPQDSRDVDPRELRLPPSRRGGADPYKLQLQSARFGGSTSGMPPPWVYEASDGVLVVYNGVTRATRVARPAPGSLIRVEVVGSLRRAYGGDPRIGDFAP